MSEEQVATNENDWLVRLPASVAAEAMRLVGDHSRSDRWVRELIERELDRLRNWAVDDGE